MSAESVEANASLNGTAAISTAMILTRSFSLRESSVDSKTSNARSRYAPTCVAEVSTSITMSREATAISSTFRRRGTRLGPEAPAALTPAFAHVPGKREQWVGFLRRSQLSRDVDFDQVVVDVGRFLGPVAEALGSGNTFTTQWPPGGPWARGASRTDSSGGPLER